MSATLVALVALALAPSLFQQGIAPSIGRQVSGRVVDGSTGRPVADAVVVLWDRSKTRSSGRRLTVGANGAFVFSDVPTGSYQIAAEVPGSRFSYRTETVDVELRESNVTGLGLLITPLGPRLIAVTGKLVMEDGGRIPSSMMRIQAGSESSPIQPDGSVQFRLRADEAYRIVIENQPEGYYIKSVSAGSWDSASDTLSFSSTPPSTMQFTLAIGARRVRGRVLDRTGAPSGAETTVTVAGPSSAAAPRSLTLNSDGTFEIARLRPGDYELKARLGSGNATQTATVQLSIGNQDRNGVDLILKSLTPQKGRVVIEGVGRIEELLRFRPAIEVRDILGVHRIAIGRDGTFEFQSFEGDYDVEAVDLPFEYRPSVVISGSFVEVRLRILQGDAPFFRFRSLPPR
jgi:Carboxypeptidase regulatory-like domain